MQKSEQQIDTKQKNLHLFEGYGIELEYMIVDSDSLNVQPICDTLLYTIAGEYLSEVDCGTISYCNELALHVVELKTTGPVSTLKNLHLDFHEHIVRINALLQPLRAKLMPTGVHPWMDPFKEMRLWEHEYNAIYESYHRIFDCRGHGWANLQSAHINLPFCGDEEFVQLHEAIRLVLPIMPALCASSPILDGKKCPSLDARLDTYRQNQTRIPSITAQVIPESCRSIQDYYTFILEPMFRDIKPHDPDNILQYEWLNSRGAIARFDRSTIEIRALDIQECAKADIAIAQSIVSVLQTLIKKNTLHHFPLEQLVQIFTLCVKDAETALITDLEFLAIFGIDRACSAQDLWKHLLQPLLHDSNYKEIHEVLNHILTHGSLASRILRAWQQDMSKNGLHAIFERLSQCLATNSMF